MLIIGSEHDERTLQLTERRNAQQALAIEYFALVATKPNHVDTRELIHIGKNRSSVVVARASFVLSISLILFALQRIRNANFSLH